jgi:tyrosine-protein kinase Etk/Wzc
MTDSISGKAPEKRAAIAGLLQYWSVIRPYKTLILGTAGIAGVLAVLFSVVSLILPPERSPLPNRYQAYAVLLMQQEKSATLEDTLASLGLLSLDSARVSQEGFDYASLAIKVMNSREFLDILIAEFGLEAIYKGVPDVKTLTRLRMQTRSSFVFDVKTRTLTISYTDIDPVLARDVVVRMVELLNEWFQTRGGTDKLKKKTLLEEKLGEVSVVIANLEKEIKDFQAMYGVLRVEDLAASQAKILDNLRSQLRLKESEIQNYTRFVQIEDPTLSKLKSERDNLLDQIQRVERGFTNPSGTSVPAKLDLPDLAQRFEHLSSALDIQKSIYKAMSEQYELTKLSLESEPVFTVLDAAEVPDQKIGPSRGRICIIAVILASIGSLALALLLNSIKKLSIEPSAFRKLKGRVE